MKPYLSLLLASLIVPLSAGCSSENSVTAIAFDKTSYLLDVGEQVTVNIRYTGSGKTAKFFSSNDLVVRVDDKGTLTGVARGEATVFAVCNDIIARASVMVFEDPATDKIYQSKGTMSFSANVPAFNLDGTLSSPFTFITGTSLLDGAYLAHDLPDKELLESFLTFMDSPFIQENPNFHVPEAYGIYKEAITILLEQEAPYSVRHLLHEDYFTSYFYAGDKYVSKASIDATKGISYIKLAGLILDSNISALTLDDIVNFFKARIDEGEQTYDTKEMTLFFGALANATYATKDETDSLGLTVTIGEGFFDYVLDYLGNPSFGQLAQLKEIKLNTNLKKKDVHYEIEAMKVHIDSTFFGMENTMDAEVLVPEKRERLADDALEKIIKELEALA